MATPHRDDGVEGARGDDHCGDVAENDVTPAKRTAGVASGAGLYSP
jgi:hypothetical protein